MMRCTASWRRSWRKYLNETSVDGISTSRQTHRFPGFMNGKECQRSRCQPSTRCRKLEHAGKPSPSLFLTNQSSLNSVATVNLGGATSIFSFLCIQAKPQYINWTNHNKRSHKLLGPTYSYPSRVISSTMERMKSLTTLDAISRTGYRLHVHHQVRTGENRPYYY